MNRTLVIATAMVTAAAVTLFIWFGSDDGRSLGSSAAFDRSVDTRCAATDPPADLWTDLVPLTVETVIELPDATAFASHGGVAYVATRQGLVHSTTGPEGELALLVDLSDDTSVDSDRGLLGMVVTPHGEALIIMRTNGNGDSVITSHRLDGTGRSSELLTIGQPDPRHNGGGLAFSANGDLYIGVGDGGGQGDPNGEASDPTTMLGSILSVQIDLDTGQVGPAFDTEPSRHELVWAIGVRNPFRIWFDSAGALWVADVGELCTEEISRLDGVGPGQDLGWSAHEGDQIFDSGRIGDREITDPVTVWDHRSGQCAAVGGTEYAGDIDELIGTVIVADLCSGSVMAIGAGRTRQIPVQLDSPIDVNIGPDGELWITDMAVGVRRITRAPRKG